MMVIKYSQLLLVILVTSHATASTIDIECEFGYQEFAAVGAQYICFVSKNLNILEPNIAIQNVIGTHEANHSVESVNGLSIENMKVEFLPANLAEIFPNLVALKVKKCGLKELHQDDLKLMTKLKYLNLDENDIEVLDDGLFEFNPQLELLWFYNNKIKRIGSSVFDNLKNLSSLDLRNNICASKSFVSLRPQNFRSKAAPRVLTSSILSEISRKCFGQDSHSVEIEKIMETSTIPNNEKVYEDKILKLESRLLEVVLMNNKTSSELEMLRKQQNGFTKEIRTEISQEYEANKKIFKLETQVVIEKTKVKHLKEKLSKKELELINMADDLSKAHESIRRYEEEIARNLVNLRKVDRSIISDLETEKSEMRQTIMELLSLINQLREQSEAEIKFAREEIEFFKVRLTNEEQEVAEVIIDKSDEPLTTQITSVTEETSKSKLDVTTPASIPTSDDTSAYRKSTSTELADSSNITEGNDENSKSITTELIESSNYTEETDTDSESTTQEVSEIFEETSGTDLESTTFEYSENPDDTTQTAEAEMYSEMTTQEIVETSKGTNEIEVNMETCITEESDTSEISEKSTSDLNTSTKDPVLEEIMTNSTTFDGLSNHV